MTKFIFPLFVAFISAGVGTVLEFIAEVKVLNYRVDSVRNLLRKEEGRQMLWDTIRGKSLILGFMSFSVWAVSWPIENNTSASKALAISVPMLLATVGLLPIMPSLTNKQQNWILIVMTAWAVLIGLLLP